jgi:glycerophosphoryl diester phosphodiesterase
MVEAPHPQSVIRTAAGREVQLKAHQALWSGECLPNSLEAIQDCYRAGIARAEIDIAMLRDADFLVVHDLDLAGSTDGRGLVEQISGDAASRLHLTQGGLPTDVPPPRLSDVVRTIAAETYPTLLELDLKDWKPWPWPRVEELARLVQPVKDRVIFGGGADWNLRRLLHVDGTLAVGFTFTDYLDFTPMDEKIDPLPGVRGAYGYLDAHPLARERLGSTRDYLRDRLGGILRLVPGVREVHVRLLALECMLDDGLTDLPDILHEQGMLLDVWTLNAGTAGWRERLRRALDAGADIITSDTPRELSAEARRT